MKLLVVLPLLAGCAATDPLTRPGEWHPVGANDANLRTMIANPRDLVVGRSSQLADGAVAASAVARYRTGKVRALADVTVSKVAPLAGAPAGAGALEEN